MLLHRRVTAPEFEPCVGAQGIHGEDALEARHRLGQLALRVAAQIVNGEGLGDVEVAVLLTPIPFEAGEDLVGHRELRGA